jgi:RNA polymerase sigma-70 factor (ECF subfamily)
MGRCDADTTDPTLLDRLGDWRDREAWVDFVARYDPVIRSYGLRFRLDAETRDELSQRIWIDLARRMRTFRYDPGKTFRGWLRRLCRSRAIDLLRHERAVAVATLGATQDAILWRPDDDGDRDADGDAEAQAEWERPLLLCRAQEVQDAVRRRVDERTWTVFWDIAIEGRSVRETSAAAGLSYAAAFAARKRVSRMLREEGRRLTGERRPQPPQARDPRFDRIQP